MRPPSDIEDWRISCKTSGRNGHARKVLFNRLSFYVGHVLSCLTPNPDPENLLVMIQTWQNGDVSMQKPYNGDFEKTMSSIKAKTLVLPAKTDLYFP